MKTVILAGGMGSRLSEETQIKPKPMVEIGGNPMLWHIMKIYASHGFREFIIALGYKGESIKDYFLNCYYLQNDLTINLENGEVSCLNNNRLNWLVDLIDTGQDSMTGGRLFRLRDKMKKSTFMLTYGDGVSDVNIKKLVAFHKAHGKTATVTAVRPTARFGEMLVDRDIVTEFKEKQHTQEGWINGGFFVFEPEIFDYLPDESVELEKAPLEALAREGQLMAFKHEGFWQCMDTLREKQLLERLWNSKFPPWKTWKS